MRLKGITVYKARIVENIFEGHVAEVALSQKMTVCQIREFLKLDEQARFFQNGKELGENQFPKEGCFTIKLVPGSFTTAMAIISVVVAVAAVVIGVVALSNVNNTKYPDLSKTQASLSLRGSTNSARKSERLPILLGKHRVYPDVAALPFSSYQDSNQYLHQLFCFGYSDVSIDYSTFKIGETLISYYEDCTYNVGLGSIYPSRVVENVYQLELKNDGTASSLVRSTASGCQKIEVGLMAPNGLYTYEGENRQSLSVGILIEWRASEGTWTTAFQETVTANTDKWRKMYSITPSGSSEGLYEVRVTRTTTASSELQACDTIYLDVIKSFVGLSDTVPVKEEGLQLIALRTKATDQLNGVIDSFNAVCTLNTRAWDGLGSGASHWTLQNTRNPASAILYLLTNSNANAEPVEDSLIDWASFEEFYAFCEEYEFNCDAWITTEYTVMQLCEFVAASNMAEMIIQCDKISIRVEKAQEDVVQLFTPRNAWDFEMIRSFEAKPKNITVNFDDETKGYVQVEREISLDDNGAIVFDSTQDGDSLTIDAFGVTSADHAARLGAQKLKLLYSQTRTYSWKSDIEGIVCLPGDVVLLENDNFLLGLGEGRIKKILYSGSKVSAIVLDTRMKMVSGTSYGVRIRTNSVVLDSLPVVTNEGESWELTFQTPLASDVTISVGDLVAFGELKIEAHKVLITEMTPDQNRSCTFSAVDYSDDAYSQELTIPAYDSGLSMYPSDGGAVGATASSRVPHYFVYGTQGQDGLSAQIQYAYSFSATQVILDNVNLFWQEKNLSWNGINLLFGSWYDKAPSPVTGLYIWIRTRVGDGQWSYCRLTGENSKIYKLECSDYTIVRNDRLSLVKTITIIAEIQGYNNPHPKLYINDINQKLSYDATRGKYYFVYSYSTKYATSINLALYEEGELTPRDSFTIALVDETKALSGAYLGELSALPEYFDADNSLGIIDGDYFIVSEDFTSEETSFQKGVPFVYSNGIWSALKATDDDYSEKMLQCLGGVLRTGTDTPSISALYAWFENLTSQNAVISSLTANEAFIKNLSANEAFIKLLKVFNFLISEENGLNVEIRSTDDDGDKLDKPVFKISYAGNTVFQIDASSGNVFMGKPNASLTAPASGFMYKASDKTILSKNGNFQLSEGGSMIAINGLFKGSFDCNVIKTSKQTSSALSFSLSTISNRQASILENSFASNSLSEGFYQCTLSDLASICYVKYFNYEYWDKGSVSGSIITHYSYISYTSQGAFAFYDKNLSEVDISSYVQGDIRPSYGTIKTFPNNVICSWCCEQGGEGKVYEQRNEGRYFSTARTLKIFVGGDLLVVDLPVSSTSLPTGAIYRDGDTLKVVL